MARNAVGIAVGPQDIQIDFYLGEVEPHEEEGLVTPINLEEAFYESYRAPISNLPEEIQPRVKELSKELADLLTKAYYVFETKRVKAEIKGTEEERTNAELNKLFSVLDREERNNGRVTGDDISE